MTDTNEAQRERMSPEFEKEHLVNGRARHYFTGPDRGGPHDHPCAIDIEVVDGGYDERVYRIHDDGSWTDELIVRRPGDKFTIKAKHIHEIIRLHGLICITEARYHPHTRETRFYRFDRTGVRSRAWNDPHFEEAA